MKSLRRLTPDEIYGGKALFVYETESLKEAAEELKSNAEMFIEKDKEVSSLENYLDKITTDYIIAWNEKIILNPDSVFILLSDLRSHRDAGFVAAKFVSLPTGYTVDNIYEISKTTPASGEGLVKVDYAQPDFIVCRKEAYLEMKNESSDYFGIELRKLGYQNYLNTRIQVSTEGINE